METPGAKAWGYRSTQKNQKPRWPGGEEDTGAEVRGAGLGSNEAQNPRKGSHGSEACSYRRQVWWKNIPESCHSC